MKDFKLALIGATVLGSVIAGSAAHATVLPYGTLTFTNYSGTSVLDTGSTLLATSGVTIPDGTIPVFGNDFYLQSAAGITVASVFHALTLPVTTGFTAVGGSAVSLSTNDVSPTTGSLTVTVGSLAFDYTSEVSSYTTLGKGATLTLAFSGTLVADSSNAVATPASSDFVIAITQATLGSGNISYTANLDVPNIQRSVPEPISLTLLGSGLLGLGLARRRRGRRQQ
jgi:hypothetical protein